MSFKPKTALFSFLPAIALLAALSGSLSAQIGIGGTSLPSVVIVTTDPSGACASLANKVLFYNRLSGHLTGCSAGTYAQISGVGGPPSGAAGGDVTGSFPTSLVVQRLNGVLLSALPTGLLKITTGTGVPSAASASDINALYGGATGSGSNVLQVSPTFTGTVAAANLTVTGTLTASAAGISGLSTIATSGSASDLSGGTVAPSLLPLPGAASLGGVQSKALAINQFLTSISTSGVVSAAQPSFSNLSGTLTPAQIPTPTASTLGGVQSKTAVSNQFLTSISTAGVPISAQPAFTDISGTVTSAQLPAPGPAALGGVQSKAVVASNFITGISTLGVVTSAQPAASDVSGLAPSATVDALNASNISSGTLPAARLPNPTGATLGGVQSKTAVGSQFLTSISTSGVPSSAQPAFTDISGTVAAAQLPAPSASTLGGVQSKTPVTNQFLTSISTLGVPTSAQPDFADLTGTLTPAQIPNPSATTLGGVQSKAVVTNQFLTSISTSGVPSSAQPSFSNLSGSVAAAQLPNPGAASLGGVQSKSAVASNFLTSISTSGVVSSAQPTASDISGLASSATVDTTNAGNITAGSLGDARLSSNVPLKNGANTFAAKNGFTPTSTVAGVNLGTLAGDPSTPVNGDMWYNSSLGKYRCYEAGAIINCVGGNGAQTTSSNTYAAATTQDFSAAGHTLPAAKGTIAAKPATCTIGELYFATDATPGGAIYQCSATNTWTAQLTGSGSTNATTVNGNAVPTTASAIGTDSSGHLISLTPDIDFLKNANVVSIAPGGGNNDQLVIANAIASLYPGQILYLRPGIFNVQNLKAADFPNNTTMMCTPGRTTLKAYATIPAGAFLTSTTVQFPGAGNTDFAATSNRYSNGIITAISGTHIGLSAVITAYSTGRVATVANWTTEVRPSAVSGLTVTFPAKFTTVVNDYNGAVLTVTAGTGTGTTGTISAYSAGRIATVGSWSGTAPDITSTFNMSGLVPDATTAFSLTGLPIMDIQGGNVNTAVHDIKVRGCIFDGNGSDLTNAFPVAGVINTRFVYDAEFRDNRVMNSAPTPILGAGMSFIDSRVDATNNNISGMVGWGLQYYLDGTCKIPTGSSALPAIATGGGSIFAYNFVHDIPQDYEYGGGGIRAQGPGGGFNTSSLTITSNNYNATRCDSGQFSTLSPSATTTLTMPAGTAISGVIDQLPLGWGARYENISTSNIVQVVATSPATIEGGILPAGSFITSTTIQFTDLYVNTAGSYVGGLLTVTSGTGTGSSATINAFATTRVATVGSWSGTTPDATSAFAYNGGGPLVIPAGLTSHAVPFTVYQRSYNDYQASNITYISGARTLTVNETCGTEVAPNTIVQAAAGTITLPALSLNARAESAGFGCTFVVINQSGGSITITGSNNFSIQGGASTNSSVTLTGTNHGLFFASGYQWGYKSTSFYFMAPYELIPANLTILGNRVLNIGNLPPNNGAYGNGIHMYHISRVFVKSNTTENTAYSGYRSSGADDIVYEGNQIYNSHETATYSEYRSKRNKHIGNSVFGGATNCFAADNMDPTQSNTFEGSSEGNEVIGGTYSNCGLAGIHFEGPGLIMNNHVEHANNCGIRVGNGNIFRGQTVAHNYISNPTPNDAGPGKSVFQVGGICIQNSSYGFDMHVLVDGNTFDNSFIQDASGIGTANAIVASGSSTTLYSTFGKLQPGVRVVNQTMPYALVNGSNPSPGTNVYVYDAASPTAGSAGTLTQTGNTNGAMCRYNGSVWNCF